MELYEEDEEAATVEFVDAGADEIDEYADVDVECIPVLTDIARLAFSALAAKEEIFLLLFVNCVSATFCKMEVSGRGNKREEISVETRPPDDENEEESFKKDTVDSSVK